MKKNNTIEQDVNKIRLAIYEETKNMTIQERRERLEKVTNPAIQKYGLNVIPSAGSKIATL
ncbi:MAG: hypothetical protein LBR68_03060 [Lachnoclostridium sp.]|jgi:hypothetical protein|nr:hypothetical protein [Lachnoclostridium sp.]